MTWYYAVGSQQQGPVTEDQLRALVSDGVVTGDTLVWRDGMANWQPYRTVLPPGVSLPAPAASTPSAFAPASAAFQTATSVVGGLSEQQVLDREYRVEIGEGLDQGWKVFTGNAGVIIGVGVVWLILIAMIVAAGLVASLVPILELMFSVVFAFLSGAIMVGPLYFFLRMVRGEPGRFGDAFCGFGSRFIQLCLTGFVQGLINAVIMVPITIAISKAGLAPEAIIKAGRLPELPLATYAMLAGLAGATVLVQIYVGMLWTFSLLLVQDKNYDFWSAMQLSRRKVFQRQWMTFLYLFVGGVLCVPGFFACGIGLFVTVPVFYGMYAHLYDVNFRDLAPAREE